MNLLEQVKPHIGKYFLIENDEDGFPQPVYEVPKNQYESLIEATLLLNEFVYFQRKVLEVEMNYDDYFRIVNNYSTILKKIKKDEDCSLQLRLAFVDINRVFINFITSLRVFIEHLEIRLKRKYGKESNEVIQFKKMISGRYDSLLSYRLFYMLRNYAIHQDYPIFNIDFDWEDNIETKESTSSVVIPRFNRDKLLENEDLKKKIGLDLRMMNTTFPVEPQMLEIRKLLAELLIMILSIELTYFNDAAIQTIQAFSNSYSKKEFYVGYVEINKENVTWKKTYLEVSTATFILHNIRHVKS